MKTKALSGPGAALGALGAILELLEELWELFWTQGCLKPKNHWKSDLVTPPPGGPIWELKFQKLIPIRIFWWLRACFFRVSFLHGFSVILGALASAKNRQNHWRVFQNQGFQHTWKNRFWGWFWTLFWGHFGTKLAPSWLQRWIWRVRKRIKKKLSLTLNYICCLQGLTFTP